MTARLSRFTPFSTGLLMLHFAPLLHAAEPVAQSSPSPFMSLLQMLLALGIVLLTIAGMAWLMRRLSPGQVGNASDMRVVAAVAVGPKERVVMVDVGDTRLVLGVAAGQVTCLKEMPRPVEPETEAAPGSQVFLSKLKERLATRGKAP